MEEAIAKFRRAIQQTPDNDNAFNGLGWALFNSGHLPEAEVTFQRVIQLTPDHPADLKRNCRQLYLAQRKYDLAETYLLKAGPHSPAAWWGAQQDDPLQENLSRPRNGEMIVDSGQGDESTRETARRMLQAAKEKHLPEGLRRRDRAAIAGEWLRPCFAAGRMQNKAPARLRPALAKPVARQPVARQQSLRITSNN